MTEAEWLACDDPHQMICFLEEAVGESKAGRRKVRLLLAACCRRAWHRFPDPRPQGLIETSERYADSQLPYREFREVWDAVFRAHAGGAEGAHVACMASHYQIWAAARDGWPKSLTGVSVPKKPDKSRLVRDVFGDPFCKVKLDKKWRAETVVALASGIYAERAFDRMPILADALEDAGCDHADILAHCRGDGPHVRGCWVVDLILGKS